MVCALSRGTSESCLAALAASDLQSHGALAALDLVLIQFTNLAL